MHLPRRLLCLTLCLWLFSQPLSAALAEDDIDVFISEEAFAEALRPYDVPNRIVPKQEVPDFVNDLLAVCRMEIGYTEGPSGYTKYGAWAGDERAQWCAEFICWCVDQADKRFGYSLLNHVYPYYSAQNTGKNWFIDKGRFINRKGYVKDWGYQWLLDSDALLKKNEYVPRPGDLVFFAYSGTDDTDHVAIVECCALNDKGDVIMHVIEGNNPRAVARNQYPLDSSKVLGFGTTSDIVGITMRAGNKGVKVRAFQEQLQTLGLLAEESVDGRFNAQTQAAVRNFQMGMKDKRVTGVADMATQNAVAVAAVNAYYNNPDTWLVVEE